MSEEWEVSLDRFLVGSDFILGLDFHTNPRPQKFGLLGWCRRVESWKASCSVKQVTLMFSYIFIFT